jgi:hypothetical protein
MAAPGYYYSAYLRYPPTKSVPRKNGGNKDVASKSFILENVSFYNFNTAEDPSGWTTAKATLKAKCQFENWGVNDKILHNYLTQLFGAVAKQYLTESSHARGHILDYNKGIYFSYDGEFMLFDTGLYTDDFKRIFAHCSRNRNQAAQLWFIDDWYNEYEIATKTTNGRPIYRCLPEPFVFFREYHELHYNPLISLQVNSEHMLDDDTDHRRVQTVLEQLGIVTRSKAETKDRIDVAISKMKIRVKQNSRTVVPQNFATAGIQLLLPLSFADDNKVQLVVPVTKVQLPLRPGEVSDPYNPSQWQYVGRTVLDMDMAYNNARLLNRLESEWLKPPEAVAVLPDGEAGDEDDAASVASSPLTDMSPSASPVPSVRADADEVGAEAEDRGAAEPRGGRGGRGAGGAVGGGRAGRGAGRQSGRGRWQQPPPPQHYDQGPYQQPLPPHYNEQPAFPQARDYPSHFHQHQQQQPLRQDPRQYQSRPREHAPAQLQHQPHQQYAQPHAALQHRPHYPVLNQHHPGPEDPQAYGGFHNH